MRLVNKVAMQRFYTLFVTERSRLSAARFSFKLASRKQPWAAPDCMLALLRACMACRGLIAAAKRMSAAFGDARSALLDSAHRAMCIALFSTDETLSCALSAGGGHHRQVGSKLSIFQRQRYCLALNELIMGHCVAQRVSLSFTRKCGPKLTGFLTR